MSLVTPAISGSPRVILLIDDDEDQLLLFQTLLRQTEATVLTARSAKEGFEMLGEVRPDLVICDVLMPNVSGRDFMRQLRSNALTKHLPVIAFSTLPRDVESEILSCGADSFCSKTEARKLIREAKLYLQ